MPPKAMSQAAIKRLITQRVNAALEAERASQANAEGQGSNANGTGGQGRAPPVRKGLEVSNRKSWGDMKKMMMEEFCPDEEIIMANPLPNHVVNIPDEEQVQPEPAPALLRFAPAVLDIPNNNNGWIEEDSEEDPEIEEEEMEIKDEMNDPEVIYPYEIEEGELPPPPADSDTSSDSEPEVEAEDRDENEAATVGTITRTPYHVQPFLELCPDEEVQRLEDELRSLKLRDTNIAAYTQRFNELVFLCPDAVSNEKKKVEYIRGLPKNIKGERQGNARAMITAPAEQSGYRGNKPLCNSCKKRHIENCTLTCHNYGKPGHYGRDCKKKAVATGANTQSTLVCYGVEKKGYTRNYCSNKNNPQGEEARGRAYVIKEADKNQGPNVVM
nr:hypothetical protein [Tanacetum cinerariifolium]